MNSAPPKQVEHPTANAEPRNIIFTASSHRFPVPSVRRSGSRQTAGAPVLAAIQTPTSRMPIPAAIDNGRFQDSINPDACRRSPASPASAPLAVKTIVNPAMKQSAVRRIRERAAAGSIARLCMLTPASANV